MQMPLDMAKIEKTLDNSLEAAIDPMRWPDILDNLVSATGSFSAHLTPTSAITPDTVVCTDSMKAGIKEYFADGWHLNDWRLRGIPVLMRTGTARDQEYSSREDFERNPFYRFQAKHRIGKSCIIGFTAAPGELLALTLHRTLEQDFYSDQEAAVLQRVGMRLAGCAKIAQAISSQRVAGMTDAFQMAGVAAVFFDRSCRVTTVTGAAETLFGSEIDVKNRMLVCRVHGVTSSLQRKMRAVTGEGWLSHGEPSDVVFVERDNGKPLRVVVQRLGGLLPDLFAHSVGVCLFSDASRSQAPSVGQLSALFGLTTSEGGVAQMIAQGLSLREIAKQKKISYETVRTHLRAIFSKTKTRRQAELAKLLAQYES